jgi:hypothetical protein
MNPKLPYAIQKLIAATQVTTNVPVKDVHEGIGKIELAHIRFKQAESYGESVLGLNPEAALLELTKLCLETLTLYQEDRG